MHRFAFLLAAGLAANTANATLPIFVTLESEAAGIQNSTSGFSAVGVETFESRSTGANQTFATTFGGSAFGGSYTGVRIDDANQYGSAGGVGNNAVTFTTAGYSLDLTSSPPGGVTYFGFWLSALDRGNEISFFQGGNKLFTFSAAAARTFIDGLPNSSSYFGNPNTAFAGQNRGEPYAFLNFYARSGVSFDRIVFAENPEVGGFESDNHTVGRWTRTSGTPLIAAVPEPASWAMLITGFGLVGASMRRQRMVAA